MGDGADGGFGDCVGRGGPQARGCLGEGEEEKKKEDNEIGSGGGRHRLVNELASNRSNFDI